MILLFPNHQIIIVMVVIYLTNNTYLSLCRQKEVSFYAVFRDSVYNFFTIKKETVFRLFCSFLSMFGLGLFL